MERLKRTFGWQTVMGRPVTRGDFTVTPQSQALTIRWPKGGLVWNRPVAILVERGGQTERIRIVDITRVLQWALLGFSLVVGIITVVLAVLHRRDRNG